MRVDFKSNDAEYEKWWEKEGIEVWRKTDNSQTSYDVKETAYSAWNANIIKETKAEVEQEKTNGLIDGKSLANIAETLASLMDACYAAGGMPSIENILKRPASFLIASVMAGNRIRFTYVKPEDE